MSKVNYRLIASDFDGTLITSGQIVPESVCKAINEYVAAGGIFAVCTGRMLASILPRVRALGLSGLVVAYQGTVIADIQSGELLRCGGFALDDAEYICKVIEDFDAPINVYSDNKMYTTMPQESELLRTYEKVTAVTANRIEGKASAFVRANSMYCQKVISVIGPERKAALFNYLNEVLGDRFEITCSSNVLVEVSPKGDNKAAALAFLADYYGIPMEKTIAVGDNLNDLPMIEAAGLGVAVANGIELLRARADYVCPSNNDGGVGEVIRKYGLI